MKKQKYKILKAPNPILRQISQPIDNVNNEIQELMLDMLEIMYNNKGIGLAAIQIGINKRVIVIDIQDENSTPLFIANPEILHISNEIAGMEEGCLSVEKQLVYIERPKKITLKYVDYNNKMQIINADGLLATCIQHEIDHLNGIIILDK